MALLPPGLVAAPVSRRGAPTAQETGLVSGHEHSQCARVESGCVPEDGVDIVCWPPLVARAASLVEAAVAIVGAARPLRR